MALNCRIALASLALLAFSYIFKACTLWTTCWRLNILEDFSFVHYLCNTLYLGKLVKVSNSSLVVFNLLFKRLNNKYFDDAVITWKLYIRKMTLKQYHADCSAVQCIWYCYKANSFAGKLLSKICLFTLLCLICIWLFKVSGQTLLIANAAMNYKTESEPVLARPPSLS